MAQGSFALGACRDHDLKECHGPGPGVQVGVLGETFLGACRDHDLKACHGPGPGAQVGVLGETLDGPVQVVQVYS